MSRKRELIDTDTDKRSVRCNKRGTSFVESAHVGRSLALDRGRRAKTKVGLAKLEITRHFEADTTQAEAPRALGQAGIEMTSWNNDRLIRQATLQEVREHGA